VAHAAFEPPPKQLLPFLIPNPKVSPEELEGPRKGKNKSILPPEAVADLDSSSTFVPPEDSGFSMLNFQSEMHQVEMMHGLEEVEVGLEGDDDVVIDWGDAEIIGGNGEFEKKNAGGGGGAGGKKKGRRRRR
jgi:hypothetical protein